MAVEIRNDDVLQHEHFTAQSVNALKVKPMFEWFKDTDLWFEEKNIPMILAVVANGIDVFPEWVDYIKQRQHRYQIELHCHTHIMMRHLAEEKIYDMLMPAKEKIEKTFGTLVTRWYVPYSRKGYPGGTKEIGKRVCERMGIKFENDGNPLRHFYFHYWSPWSVAKIKRVLK